MNEPKESDVSLDKDLIRKSFELVRPHAVQVAAEFYHTLFDKYPQAQGLFEKSDMEQQYKNLATALATVVDHLDEPEFLMKDLQKRMGMSILFITHNMGVVAGSAELLNTYQHAVIFGDPNPSSILQ